MWIRRNFTVWQWIQFLFERVALKCRGSPDIHHDTSSDCTAPSGSAVQAAIAVSQDLVQSDTSYSTIFNKLKKEHDLAKAMKNNDAACPVYLWDEAVWAGTPSQKGLTRNKRTELPSLLRRPCKDCVNNV
jgi:hypothetical protein